MPSCNIIEHGRMVVDCPLNLIYERVAGLDLAGLGSRGCMWHIDHGGGRRHDATEFKVQWDSRCGKKINRFEITRLKLNFVVIL